jgi:hypothetical protein
MAMMEAQMVELDYNLVKAARRLITGANNHRIAGMIFVYQQAVALHNRSATNHIVYQEQYERELRRMVREAAVKERNRYRAA